MCLIITLSIISNPSFAQSPSNLLVPFYNNAYTVPRADEDINITKEGLLGWTDSNRITKVYFYVSKPNNFHVSLKMSQVFDACNLTIKLDGKSNAKNIKINNLLNLRLLLYLKII